jgi:cyclophilin family peptidyl-prolyl cis-trans isomerase
MMRRFSLAACGLAVLCGWPQANAQEAKQPTKAPAAKAPAAKAPQTAPKGADKAGLKTDSVDVPAPKAGARAEFDKQMEEWRVILKKMRELRTNFQTAKDDEQKKLNAEFDVEVAKGRQMLPKLRESAMAAWVETGSADPQLERFLLKFVADAMDQDNFEEGLAIAKKLLDGGCTENILPAAAGVCAYATSDFAAAEGYLKTASDNGSLLAQDNEISKLGAQFAPQVATQKGHWEKELAIRKAEEAKDDLPRVKLTTNKGVIVLELFENEAPDTVGNFISLVEKKFYDGLTFHRVLQHFMAQGGCPKGDGTGGPGYQIYCECYKPERRRHFRGSLSMAHAGRDSGGSQFFLTFVPTSVLDDGLSKHTCFGRVIEGMDVLGKIQRRDPEMMQGEIIPDKIVTAEVVRKRDHVYAPKKVEQ